MSKEILKLENVEKKYSGSVEELHIINNLSFSVEEGEFISILGRSGSGKSTLLNIMGLLDRVDGGKIFIGGQEVDKLSEEERDKIKNQMIGFVFQFHYLLPEFTALENVMLPALLNNFDKKLEIEKRAKELLEKVGLGERENHKPSQLSGGEKQRVAIARALINSPKILLADEPTGNLDEETSEMIFKILKDINKNEKQTIIVVTHSKDLAEISDKQLYLKKGVLVEG
ncbi:MULTISPECIES: ABC transporter ATP-binding protein [Fusobacterium]|mgnify:CR=1 FL=1|jgi:lipoprotein-releasing system ATP-binding protein|uniref:ABC transporter ATP-binding protein n=3 Tax=Fusobacterium mortiferum TaxID=850 RepID=A0A414Q2Q0_FUSMR|nr:MULTISPECIES: ABC transporter ATP-binding protein [Fusobacterium]AVQ18980.1 ABC transporter ATP-binding protein [Fusobacterium mortiferum ATCC 9817]EEO35228.1 lipoprotein releasing system, ATP-binding protein [Fusobacterium mortiferum ATCC 9817]MCF2626800.1 ABC transporter ATP-binding protein [Fusobacterium mortiferum]MCF2698113.1 ABC transporter ATP-binding protein [Fusobacterium mortiferum]MCI7666175.1 ABC transporter ATP-binding protein [Fusobacterium mortiferum]